LYVLALRDAFIQKMKIVALYITFLLYIFSLMMALDTTGKNFQHMRNYCNWRLQPL